MRLTKAQLRARAAKIARLGSIPYPRPKKRVTVKVRPVSVIYHNQEPRSKRFKGVYKTVKGRRILNAQWHNPKKQIKLDELVTRVVVLAQTLAEKRFYAYQIELTHRIVESLLLHDGDTITSLMARQAGKTESLGAIAAAIAIIFPKLAKQFPDDWRLNITDDSGIYRGFRNGVSIGIYAPRMDQSQTMFDRVQKAFETKTAKKVLRELSIKAEISNGEKQELSNGSTILCQSASEQSKIEGKTHHLLIEEEAQDISDIKIRKSLSPMVSSTMGTTVMIGTATNHKCDFYSQIKTNERSELITGTKNHFFFPYQVVIGYNSLYAQYIDKERVKLGEDSDEFRMSYGGEWIFERGMFVTNDQLFSKGVVSSDGHFSVTYPFGLPAAFKYFSLVAGIDWGRSHDSTVVTIMAVDWNNPIDSGYYVDENGEREFTFYRKHLVHWIEFIGDNYETQFWAISEYFKSLPNLRKIVMDSNTCGLPIFDRFSAAFAGRVQVEPCNFSPRVKSDLYKSFYMDICGKRFTFPAAKRVRETKEYRRFCSQMLDLRKTYKNGLMSVEHPDEKDAHDDYPDSAALAVWGANTPAFGSNLEYSNSNFLYRT